MFINVHHIMIKYERLKQSINQKVNQSKMFTNVHHIMKTLERRKQSIKH